jgi:hypothetical protein
MYLLKARVEGSTVTKTKEANRHDVEDFDPIQLTKSHCSKTDNGKICTHQHRENQQPQEDSTKPLPLQSANVPSAIQIFKGFKKVAHLSVSIRLKSRASVV